MSHTKDFLATPALSLSLAGIFRDGRATEATAVEVVEEYEQSGGFGGRREETVEISSENSGPAKSRSDDDYEAEGEHGDEEDEDTNKKKKRKKYHRHTAQQIREMETLFKESPHPDEKQRQELSKQLGLHPRQVKFWFQNRRTQIKAIQERHENSLLKTEMEKIQEENKALRETIEKSSCPNCGFATSTKDATEEQQIRIENAKLKEEVEKLRTAIGKCRPRTSPSSSCSSGNEQGSRSSLDFYIGIFGLEMSRIMDAVKKATDELKKMATSGEPLWIRSYETGREILNYDAYMKEFSTENSNNRQPKTCIEASRETGIIFLDLPQLIQSFMDVQNRWKELFPCLISKAATVYVISNGEGVNRDGAVQLMFAELQMLTPMVATREVYFVRCCKKLSADQWAIVDVSIDKVEDNIDVSLAKCRKRPSGCIIQDTSNGRCKVTWVEHLECQKNTVHSLYRTIVNSGLAFGAKHWIATLQQQGERLVFFMATNVPIKDSSGIATVAGRKSTLKLAERLTRSFCRALGASSYHTWSKIPSKTGDDIRFLPYGCPSLTTSCSTSYETKTTVTSGTSCQLEVQCNAVGYLAKGQDRGNAVTIQATKSKDQTMWILQDSCTNAYESMVVYAPVDINGMQSVMTGCDSSNIAVLSSGFSILPDGIESRSLVITSRPEKSTEGGSLLTIAFQVLTSNSPTAKLSVESIESVNTLISCTLQNIKRILQCEE
ncbi:Homeobox-leucine zipper protein GLABRA 2 [Forsythia ovata]|uniref:Homeobox-leucine zipper protein GLABRA 2 n=1 Tax=Forsythia ovata TaxID=205694 RepID=A0ABD1PFL8_9LAMI